jgi:hypothetical protein
MQDGTKPNFIIRFLGALPIVGYTLRCFREERVEAIAWLGLDFVLAATLAIILWGYPALITLLLCMVVMAGALILSTTIG